MKLSPYILIFLFINVIDSFPQSSCLPEGIYFYSQAQIDNFSTNYPNCTEIEGNVRIQGITTEEITNLNGLQQLESIQGYLRIYYNDNLYSLSGLNNIETVGDVLAIGYNNNISDLSGLNSISSIDSNIYIYDNNNLINLNGLSNLSTLSGVFSIYENPNLQSLYGINNLSHVVDLIYISDNPELNNIDALSNLTSINKNISIWSNPSLENLNGLSNIQSIGTYLDIYNNDLLVDLSGLESLSTIGGFFALEENDNLINLNSLKNLTAIGGFIYIDENNNLKSLWGLQNIDPYTINSNYNDFSDLEIHNNPKLSHCEVESICSFLDIPGRTKDIHDNASGCNDESEIEDACQGPACTNLYNPQENDQNVPVDTDISWWESQNAIGYNITIGTQPETGDIISDEDVGNETQYSPAYNLPCASEIFVKIVPYNYSPNTRDCAEESFYTEEVVADAGEDKIICPGSSTNLNASGGSLYHWSPSIGLSNPNIANPIASPVTNTQYIVTVSNENGCMDTDTVLIELFPTVNANPVVDTICSHSMTNILVSTSNQSQDSIEIFFTDNPLVSGEKNHLFANGTGIISDTIVIDSQDICQPQLVTYYAHTIINGVSCENEDSMQILVYPPLSLSEPMQQGICFEDLPYTLYLNVECGYNNSYSFEWNDTTNNKSGYGDSIVIDSGYSIGIHTFSVTVTNSIGCSNIQYFDLDITSQDSIYIDIVGDSIICLYDTSQLQVLGNFDSYIWSTSDTTSSIMVVPDSTTTYFVNATNQYGCTVSDSFIVQISIPTTPDLPDTISYCGGDSILYSAPSGYSSYSWYYNTTTSNPISSSKEVEIYKSGTYILLVTNNLGCTAENSMVSVQKSQIIPFIIGDTSICYNTPKTLIIATGGDFDVYEWRYNDKNGNLVIPQTNKDSIYLSDGHYYLYVSDGKCSGATTFSISRKQKVEPHILPDVDTIKVCHGGDTTLVAPVGYVSYQWSTGSFNDTIFNIDKGNYYLTVTDADGCQGVDSIYIFAYPKMYPFLGDSIELCADDQVWLSPGKFIDYIWYMDGNHLVAFDGKDSILVSDGGLYVVDVFNEIGCMETDSILVKKTDNLTPGILGIEDICDDDVVVLRSSGSYFKYTWTNSDNKVLGNTDTLEFSMISGKDIDTITLTVETKSGCKGSISQPVHRFLTPDLELGMVENRVCGTGSIDTTVLNFNDYFIKGEPSKGIWKDIDNSGIFHNSDWSEVNFENVNPGNYRYAFTTNTASGPCENVSDTLYIEVISCICDILDKFTRIIPVDSCKNNIGSIFVVPIDSTEHLSKISWSLSDGEIISGQGTKAILTNWSTLEDTTKEVIIKILLQNEFCTDSLKYIVPDINSYLVTDLSTTVFQPCGAIIYNKEVQCPKKEYYMGWVDHETGKYFRYENKNQSFFVDTFYYDSLSQRSYFINCTDCTYTNVISYREVNNRIKQGCDTQKWSFTLYPNPNNGEFILNLEGNYSGILTYEIFNAMGKKLLESHINKHKQITKENIKIDSKNGVYYIRMYDENGNIYTKAIILVK